ncbi:hypothetical protein NMG60_11009600 [Bertholletia excelsa]
MLFDYDTPLDHSCSAWQGDDSIIPAGLFPLSDHLYYFYVKIVVEFSTHVVHEDESLDTPRSTDRILTFLTTVDCLVSGSDSGAEISRVLSALDVPMDLHPYMLERICQTARSIAEADHNRLRRVLPMIVSIYVEDYVVVVVEEEEEEDEGAVTPRPEEADVAAATQAGEADMAAAKAVGVEKCMVCLEDVVAGEEDKKLRCVHVYHEACITRWLQVSRSCPICRLHMPSA